jgi:hypothetical protein
MVGLVHVADDERTVNPCFLKVGRGPEGVPAAFRADRAVELGVEIGPVFIGAIVAYDTYELVYCAHSLSFGLVIS